MTWTVIAEIAVNPRHTRVFEHGWQSWSPTTWYQLGERPHRPVSDRNRLICYRPEVIAPADTYWGEGLLAVELSDGGPTHIFAALAPELGQPSIRAEVSPDNTIVVSADGPVSCTDSPLPGSQALAHWAAGFGSSQAIVPAPTLWSHWYHYYGDATSTDIMENVAAIEENDLAVDVIAIDDAYETAIGDWLSLTDGFRDLREVIAKIRDRGFRAGIWLAPFMAGEHSTLAGHRSEWLVKDSMGTPKPVAFNWNQNLFALDTTRVDAMEWLAETIHTFREWGVDFFKMDFLYAGAVAGQRKDDTDGVSAYRHGMQIMRRAMGDSYFLACGAPILPSVGLVDAMRVSPDTDAAYTPPDGDMSQPSQQAAVLTGRGRAFMDGRWWTNDADCLMARPGVERREEWAEHVRRYSGLRGSGDRIRSLDDWGLETTRSLLRGHR